ncbi:MAG TPA: glucosyl transferase, partial [Bacteroidota bacterium]
QLKIENAAPPYSVALSRDGNTLSTVHILSSDTLLIDEGLAPSTTYTYRASLTLDNNIVVRSPDAQARTLDTTSHNWVFDPPVMLGDGSSSVLYDVVIINDTLAYAVGEIYKMDSLGNWDPNAYNLVKWDGSSWELMRIQFYTICGQPSRTPYPAKAIFAFSENDVWITSQGGQVARWDGTTQTATMCMPDPFVVNKL